MNKTKVGIFGLLALAMGGLLSPATASAQECGYHRYYAPAPVYYHDRYWREREWRIAREREIIHQREWRARHGYGWYGYR